MRVFLLLPLFAAGCGTRPPAPPAPPASLRLERHGHRVERVGGTVYAMGGYGAGDSRASAGTWAFRLPDGRWRPRAEMRTPRSFFGSGVVDGTLYAIGGTIERYDEGADRWEVVVAGPMLPKSHFATAVFAGRVHLIGGLPSERAGHLVFDPRARRVERAPPPPGYAPGDHLHVAAAIGTTLHVVGGFGDDGLRDDHFAFDGTRWRERARAPAPVFAKFAAVAVVDDTLYVFAMEGSFAYEARTDRWRAVAPMPAPLAMPGTVVLGGRIVVVGGRAVGDARTAAYRYDPAANRWTSEIG